MCGGGSDSRKELERQQVQRQQNIQQGMVDINRVFSGYGPEYYAGIRKATLGTLVPQFEKQYRRARKQTAFGLADRGLRRSSSAIDAGTELEQERGLGRMFLENQAENVVRDTKAQVERQRSTAVSQLISSQDPALAAQQAIAGTATIAAPSMAAPLGQFFNTAATGYLANRIGKTYNEPEVPSAKTAPLGSNYYAK